MLAIARRNEILTLLQTNQSVIVSEMSRLYGVTEETIRRDLEELEKRGFAKKTYGGAVYAQAMVSDLPMRVREKTNAEAKSRIAELAAELVADGEALMMDSSSTALMIGRRLRQTRRVTIITNSVEMLMEYADARDSRIISTGGCLREASYSLCGADAEALIRRYNADKAIISCKGLSRERGVTESAQAEAEVKKAMMDSAGEVILAADLSKFDKVSFVRLTDMARVGTVLTNAAPDEAWTEFFEQNDVKVRY
ncbi:MAG: DeoR/GlpR family DNA-binding transcription regulator [Firmicutes bacterium]|nr:DeoR/GlpR family DNA-binding transcription regulator [Bacillota bacterium]